MSLVGEIEFHVLEAITNSFSEEQKVGSGPYGDVYKGMYNGEEIAVKKLYQLHGLDDTKFNDFRNLRNIHHENIVRLIGYCCESRRKFLMHNGQTLCAIEMERALCFEYMRGGSLHEHISDESCDLDWSTCYKIIKGICEGLNHLHNAQGKSISHLDLKPANILLDENMTAKIGDLGLSLLVASSLTYKTEKMRGACAGGYTPPEYIHTGTLSKKFDVFSLGVLIMKIMTGNKGYSGVYELPAKQFVELVTKNWKERLQGTSGHSSQEINILQVKACVDIALRCVHADRNKRPRMNDIVDQLGEVDSKIKTMLSFDQSKDRIGLQEERIRPKISLVGEIELHVLEAITDNFSEEKKVGSGPHGDVYKGVYNGEEVAVKKLYQLQGLDDKKFGNEFHNLSKVDHPNVVRLIGYCYKSEHKHVEYNGRLVFAQVIERALCFEYMRGGSLDKHISDESCDLDWLTCYKIIKGTCEGLNHLHTAREKAIFHLYLTPANILLDENMTAKIGDLGLSSLVASSQAHKTETMRGTKSGFMPPEYIKSGTISKKFDVFSLGVIIMKIMAGNKGYACCYELHPKQFLELVTNSWKERLQAASGSSLLQEINILQMKACVNIAMRCIHANPNRRPYVMNIINQLEELELKIKKMSLFADQSKGPIGLQNMELINTLERIVDGSEEPKHLDLSLLQNITEYFNVKRRIGVGGCAEVYKGTLRNGVIVAVKRLFKSCTIKEKMFDREVASLIKVKHQNIVRFLGYCSLTEEHLIESGTGIIMVEIRERLLCFEYIRNGSLHSRLTDELRGLQWHKRYEIILGICNGLLYLHKNGIIHMDLKPANILLDDIMVPKITDFGLSRLESDHSQTATASRLVSRGYCDPEYLLQGKSSSKSDVYSLGVIILELVTGSKSEPDIPKVLRRWRHMWIKSSKHKPLSYQQVTKCLELAQRCTQHDPAARPDVSDILHELDQIDSKEDQFQEIPNLEDMLGIEPLEIHFPFEHDQQKSHTIELTNDTDDYFAFTTEASLRRLHTEPDKGIVPPRSKCTVTVTMRQAQVLALPNHRYKQEIAMVSTRVDESVAAKDITQDMFIHREGKVVDEVNVTVVFGKPPLADES